MKCLIIAILFALSFLLNSCNEKKVEEPIKLSEENEQIKEEKSFSPQDLMVNIDSSELNKPIHSVGANVVIPTEVLVDILPKQIKGFKKYGNKKGYTLELGRKVSTVSTEYVSDKGVYIMLSINDFGKNAIVNDTVFYDKLPEEANWQTEKLTVKNGKAFIQRHEVRDEARINAFYYHRFLFKIEFGSLVEGYNPESILTQVDFKKLLKLSKEY